MLKLVEIFIGGGIGSVMRGLITSYAADKFAKNFPYGVLLVNVVGAFFIGIVSAIVIKYLRGTVDQHILAFIVVGMLGGFTTFSSFSLDTFNLMSNGHLWLAGTNIIANVMLCLLATTIGFLIIGR